MVELKIRLFRDGARMPYRSTDLAAGFDLYAWIGEWNEEQTVVIPPNSMRPIKTGLNMRIPAGYEVQIRPRSGLAFKSQITVQNAPGTIDADFDSDGPDFEVVVLLRNEGTEDFVVKQGDRIAQMVVHKLPDVILVEDFEDNTNRNSNRQGGLGSTGV
jgi:dUTP pyrophosphatase